MMKHRRRTTLRISTAAIVICLLSLIVSGQVPVPRKIKDARPVYPRESLRAGDEGVVLVELSVTPAGTIGQARILWSRCERLNQAALTAARLPSDYRLDSKGEPAESVPADGQNRRSRCTDCP